MFKAQLSLIALAVSAPSLASNLQDDVERIIVSGSRVIESIDEVPASITVISRKQIEDHLKVNPELQSLLAQMVPGLAPDITVIDAGTSSILSITRLPDTIMRSTSS